MSADPQLSQANLHHPVEIIICRSTLMTFSGFLLQIPDVHECRRDLSELAI